MDLEPVQSLWIGPPLSVMERLVIRSFLDHGHPFHLYTYGEVGNVPAGVIVRPAAEIMPVEEVYRCRRGYGRGSYAPFSDGFRYKLLFKRGGWWADLDAVCTRPLDFPDEHVLGYEREPDGRLHVAIGLIRAPAGSPLLRYCWQRCREIDRNRMGWGQTGPRLMAEAVRTVRVAVRILEPAAFYPVDYWRTWDLIRPGPSGSVEKPLSDFRSLGDFGSLPDAYSIHLWNSKWRHERLDRDAIYHPDSIYEQLKRRHGVFSPPGAALGAGLFTAARYHVRQWLAAWRRSEGSRCPKN
jgi:hypothetical protein